MVRSGVGCAGCLVSCKQGYGCPHYLPWRESILNSSYSYFTWFTFRERPVFWIFVFLIFFLFHKCCFYKLFHLWISQFISSTVRDLTQNSNKYLWFLAKFVKCHTCCINELLNNSSLDSYKPLYIQLTFNLKAFTLKKYFFLEEVQFILPQ